MTGIQSFRELRPNRVIAELVSVISERLYSFPDSEEFQKVLEKKKNENQHSAAFCLFMSNSSRFYFMHEDSQKGSHTIDISIYYGATQIFVLEAKILPTPKGSSKKPRAEHEYVYGKGAGIQRFKEGWHGVNNIDIPFSECGMIAYVKENDFPDWLKKINQWILDAKWHEAEQLKKIKSDKTAILQSRHSRSGNSEILLHHFWVKVH